MSRTLGELLARRHHGDDTQPGASTGRDIRQCRKTIDHRCRGPRSPGRGCRGDARLGGEDPERGRSRGRHLRIRRTDTHAETRNVRARRVIHDRASRDCGNDGTRRGTDHGWSGTHRALKLRPGRDVKRHFSHLRRYSQFINCGSGSTGIKDRTPFIICAAWSAPVWLVEWGLVEESGSSEIHAIRVVSAMVGAADALPAFDETGRARP